MTKAFSKFYHLHVHTEYSLLDGAIRLDSLIKRAKEFGMDSVAVTDHGTMFGIAEFNEKARKESIKPILGCEMYLAPRTIANKTAEDNKGLRHLVLLAKDRQGYSNLCKLASIAQLKGFYYKPRIDRELLARYSRGLIALSACLKGEIPQYIIDGRLDDADHAAEFYCKTFGQDNFFLELQHNGLKVQDKVNRRLVEMSKRLSIPLVATNDCHYLLKSDVSAHEALLCIQTGTTLNDQNRFKFDSDELYFKSPEEMVNDFRDYPEAIKNTCEIASRCNLEFDDKVYHFPRFSTGTDESVDEIFERQVREGFEKRLKEIKQKKLALKERRTQKKADKQLTCRNCDAGDSIPEVQAGVPSDLRNNVPDTSEDPYFETFEIDEKRYRQRLEYEIGVILDMGFPGYFLIVADFIRYSKENNIPVGPGRGSAAGSMVAYAMGITALDPIEHGLIFERFLNPSRISMPDIDVDFCIEGREQVYKYVVEKYGGGEYVCQIITFGKLKARAVIRDVGRVLGIPLPEVDEIAKMIPEGVKNLNQALEEVPALLEKTETDPLKKDLIDIALVLEGLPRHASTHAAGVVISDKPLVEYLPLYKGKEGEVITQFNMTFVEKIGLVKFDFLGLRNLTVIKNTLELLRKQSKPVPDLLNLDMEDEATYHLLCNADTTGVFQLESSGMKELMSKLQPSKFSDIVALVALYRPGPLDSGMADTYVKRKHGSEKVEYLFPELEPILKETYGVILYQEQVMKIAGVLANYSMADADGLRKAMGKKIKAMMAEHRSLFLKGAEENHLSKRKATEVFDLMEKFGGYGFNKSHSAAYAMVCFQTAYLKAHYPVEYMAALMTSERNNSDSVVKYMDQCRSHDIKVLPPDVNESDDVFTVTGTAIRFGLAAVKNVGSGAIDCIVSSREKEGKFHSIFDFCERVNLSKANKRVIESLIKCGAFDSTGSKRSQMMASLEDALDHGNRIQREKADAQMDLFADTQGGEAIPVPLPEMPDIKEWEENDLLAMEKETLGFYITGHPLDKYEKTMAEYANVNSLTIHDIPEKQIVRMGGTIRAVKVIKTKKGDMMAFAAMEDRQASIEVVVFPELYAAVHEIIADEAPVIVEGEVQKKENSVKLLAKKIVPMEMAQQEWTASIIIRMSALKAEEHILNKLKSIIERYPGTCRSYLCIILPDTSSVVIDLSEDNRVDPERGFFREVEALMGTGSIETKCAIVKQNQKKKTWQNKKK